jgi:hypothetical protein
MNVNILNVTSELGTPFFVINYEIKDGSLLLSTGYVVTRDSWLSKPLLDHSHEEVKQIVYIELQRYTNSLKKHEQAVINLLKEDN